MGTIWTSLMILSAVAALVCGKTGEAASSLLASGSDAVTLMLTLLGTMTLWSGLMEILAVSGDAHRLGKAFRRVLKPLFPGLRDEDAWNAITMNLSANLLGLGNAATPAGIDAAKRLAVLGKTGLNALGMLLVLDNASLQLIPTTVITLRQAAGAADPADIWGMTLLISGAASVMAIILMKMLTAGGNGYERLERRGGDGSRMRHRAAGMDEWV